MCGISFIRLLKSEDYYQKKYNVSYWGVKKLQLLLEKQKNRGQDGAGLSTLKLNTKPGEKYISRFRSNSNQSLNDCFDQIYSTHGKDESLNSEILLGHLRYGTFGKNNIEACHPFLRENNWKTKNLVVAGNFNLTNVDELFSQLIELGQHPKEKTDTVTIMERIGHFLDEENDRIHKIYKKQGFTNEKISEIIADELDIESVLRESSKKWDGGYVICGLIGHGDSFILRDPNGIRPCFYYQDEEVVVVTSERPALQTTFGVNIDQIKELGCGNALIIKKNGKVTEVSINPSSKMTSCSFERIYFSRGSDRDIYQERKKLGASVVDKVLKSINYDLDNTVFSYIPNTSESAFYGMISELENYLIDVKKKEILSFGKLDDILRKKVRIEKLIIKDAKLRTFITNDTERDEMVGHVYDITYGSVKEGVDTIVLIDDSIVRGTTLKQSVITMLSRFKPKKIVIVSSCPQIRYPDCYGIDMSKIGDFITFQACIELLKETGRESLIQEVYEKSKSELEKPKILIRNIVKELYDVFTEDEISKKISQMVKGESECEVEVVYQTIDGLRKSLPSRYGDWYFSGDYPTSGGMMVVNKSFINYFEGKNLRSY